MRESTVFAPRLEAATQSGFCLKPNSKRLDFAVRLETHHAIDVGCQELATASPCGSSLTQSIKIRLEVVIKTCSRLEAAAQSPPPKAGVPSSVLLRSGISGSSAVMKNPTSTIRIPI